jgi:hypothetical protein
MKHTILTTEIDGYTYADYVEWCNDMDEEPGDEFSDKYYEWARQEADFAYESDWDNIKGYEPYNRKVVVNGTLGLWDGRHEIMPREFDSVQDAIVACYGRSIMDIVVEWDNGTILVSAYHHDGTNRFEITDAEGGSLPYLYN